MSNLYAGRAAGHLHHWRATALLSGGVGAAAYTYTGTAPVCSVDAALYTCAPIAPPVSGVAYPACFTSQEGYDGWLHYARMAGEECSPCDDCTLAYRQRMRREGRCQAKDVKVRFLVPGVRRRRGDCAAL